jgi:hypothetical protein
MGDTGQGAAQGAAPGQQTPASYVPQPPVPARPVDAPNAPPPAPAPPADGRAESGAGGTGNRPSAASDFVNRLLRRGGVRSEAEPEPEPPREEPASRPERQPDGATHGATPPPGQPPRLSERAGAVAQQLAGLTGDELDALAQADGPFSRAVQSEIDRRTARANRERDEQGRFVRQQRVQELRQQAQATRQQARQTRQQDAYRGGDLDEAADQLEDQALALQQQETFVRGLVEAYDRVSLDPIVQALPEADRAPILAAVPDGLEGRLELVRAALKRLEQHWRADEARKLRGAPQRKRENAVRRAAAVEDDGEPELVSGIGRGRRDGPSMNDWLRHELTRR